MMMDNVKSLPWVPTHPAMMPLTEQHIEIGLNAIAEFRNKLATPHRSSGNCGTSIYDKYRPAPYEHTTPEGRKIHVTSSEIIEEDAARREEEYRASIVHTVDSMPGIKIAKQYRTEIKKAMEQGNGQ